MRPPPRELWLAAGLVILFLIVLECTGCAQVENDTLAYRLTPARYELPETCKGDLSHVRVPVLYVSLEDLNRSNPLGMRRPRLGLFVPSIGGFADIILIAKGLRPEVEAEVLRHELCHKIEGEFHS